FALTRWRLARHTGMRLSRFSLDIGDKDLFPARVKKPGILSPNSQAIGSNNLSQRASRGSTLTSETTGPVLVISAWSEKVVFAGDKARHCYYVGHTWSAPL
ncbi:hypothetical protein BaRGS_00013335, partial [Batillaria attramentaria]